MPLANRSAVRRPRIQNPKCWRALSGRGVGEEAGRARLRAVRPGLRLHLRLDLRPGPRRGRQAPRPPARRLRARGGDRHRPEPAPLPARLPADRHLPRRGRARARGRRAGEHVQRVAPREVRQPEVVRLAGLLLALVLFVPIAHAGRRTLWAGAFLVEFLSQGRLAPLSALTLEPTREPLAVAGAAVDRYVPAGLPGSAPLVLVHGFAPEGKDDARVREAATLLARCGFDVAVPTIPGLTRGRLGSNDVAPVVATLAALASPSVVLGVSVGAGPALLAAADPRVRERVRAVVSLGGYASAREVLRFWLTGAYEYGGVRGRVVHDPELVRSFVAANADLLEPAARAELMAADADRAARFLARLPPALERYLDELSPLRVVGEIRARLILIHGQSDRAVPYTESLRLAAARPERTALVLVGLVEHVEGGGGAGDSPCRGPP